MTQAVKAIFEGVAEYISELRQSLEESGAVNVAQLDGKVKSLTAQINALPLEERLAYRSQIDELHEALRIFETELVTRKEALKEQLRGVSTHSKASSAYRQSNGREEQ